MTTSSFFQTMRDGIQVSVNRWIPDGEIKGIVVINHGMAEHALRYDRLGCVLAENGYVVSAHDQRGHGKTAERAIENGTGMFGYVADKNGFYALRDDLKEVILKIKEDYPDKNVFLLGHSWGSMVSQGFIEEYGEMLKGVILSGTRGPHQLVSYGGKFLASLTYLFGQKKKKSPFLNKMAFGPYCKRIENPKTPNDWLSRDEQNVMMYMEDEWCGFVPTSEFFRTMTDMLTKIHSKKAMKKVPCNLPVLFMTGSEDPVSEYTRTVNLLEKIYTENGVKDVTNKIWKDDRHEIFNEVDKEEVTEYALNWINSHNE